MAGLLCLFLFCSTEMLCEEVIAAFPETSCQQSLAIGRGEFTTSYLVKEEEREMALRVFPAHSPDDKRRIEREIKIFQKLAATRTSCD